MRLLIVNPNATAAMTDRMLEQARQYLPEEIGLVGMTNVSGPPSIEGHEDGELAMQGTLALLQDHAFDAAIVGCFDDTGLDEARRTNRAPVIGLGEASFHAAHLRGKPYAVLTTSQKSLPVIKGNIERSDFGTRCVGVFASEVPVLDFEADRMDATRRLIAAGKTLKRQCANIHTVVLGCAGMGGLADHVEAELGLEIIDPVRAAITRALAVSAVKQ